MAVVVSKSILIVEEEIKHALPSSKAVLKSFERRRALMKMEKGRRDML